MHGLFLFVRDCLVDNSFGLFDMLELSLSDMILCLLLLLIFTFVFPFLLPVVDVIGVVDLLEFAQASDTTACQICADDFCCTADKEAFAERQRLRDAANARRAQSKRDMQKSSTKSARSESSLMIKF